MSEYKFNSDKSPERLTILLNRLERLRAIKSNLPDPTPEPQLSRFYTSIEERDQSIARREKVWDSNHEIEQSRDHCKDLLYCLFSEICDKFGVEEAWLIACSSNSVYAICNDNGAYQRATVIKLDCSVNDFDNNTRAFQAEAKGLSSRSKGPFKPIETLPF